MYPAVVHRYVMGAKHNPSVRTQIRDATLVNLSETVDTTAVLDAVAWASKDTVDQLALGTHPNVALDDWYARGDYE